MGGSNSAIQYAVPLPGTQKEGQTAIYRSPATVNGLWTHPEDFNCMGDVWRHNFNKYPETPFLGYRNPTGQVDDKGADVLQKYFTFLNFREIKKRANDIGSGMVNLELAPERFEYQHYKLRMVAIYSKNSPEYIFLDAACTLYGITSVPIYDTLGEEACEFMFEQTNLTTVFATTEHIKGLVKSIQGGCGSMKNLVIMDEEKYESSGTKEFLEELPEGTVNFWTLSQIMQNGHNSPQEHVPQTLDDIYTFSYTSGTLSQPKGAMMSNRNLLTMIMATAPLAKVHGELRYVSYLPLAHVYERVVMNYVLYTRGKYGIFNGNVFKLSEDLAILKPTVFASVPRLYSRFYDVISGKTKALKGFKKWAYGSGLKAKQENIRKNGGVTHKMWDKLVFNKMKSHLGGQCQVL
jgi:long-chain acyl-CoA synthetase